MSEKLLSSKNLPSIIISRITQKPVVLSSYIRQMLLIKYVGLAKMSLFIGLFKQSMGISPHQYVVKQRIEKAKKLLRKQDLAIADICQIIGFHNQSNFTVAFRQRVGMTPKQYRQQF